MSRCLGRRERKSLEVYARARRKEKARENKKVQLRTKAAVRESLKRYFRRQYRTHVPVGANGVTAFQGLRSIQTKLPSTLLELIAPELREYALEYWVDILRCRQMEAAYAVSP